jgi:NNP family nitrate/nitrite transporter-like MFS transporter
MAILTVLRSGHWPTLAGAWLHLTVSFMVWLLIGALSIPLAQELQLSDTQIAWLVALPLLGGALLRIASGWSADWMGARRTAVTIMLFECAVLVWGWLGVSGYGEALIFAACLGIAGASFAVSLPLAGKAYPPAAQGFVLGLAASGNIGTVFILFFAPRWVQPLGWHGVCGLMAGVAAASLLLFTLLVPGHPEKLEPPVGQWWHSAAMLVRRRAAYWLCFLYAVTFGGFVGLCSVLPMVLHEVYRFEAVGAGALTALCGLGGSLLRPVGGYLADRHGGLNTLHYVLPVAAGGIVAILSPSLPMALTMMIVTTGALGLGNGVVFQLVAEWFPKEIGLASGVVGAAGGIGGFLLPLAVGMLKGSAGNYDFGFWLFAGCVMCAWGTVIAALQSRQL